MFDGIIGEVRIYNRALSSQEIYYIYKYTRIDYWAWWRRLIFWIKETWFLITGKVNFV